MRGMESRNARARESLRLAVLISLLLHAAALLVDFSKSGRLESGENSGKSASVARSRLFVTIVRPPAPLPRVAPTPHQERVQASTLRKQTGQSDKQAKEQILTTPSGVWAARSWSSAEREDMDKFLNELAIESKPPTGRELSQRALAIARQSRQGTQDSSVDEATEQAAASASGKVADSFSLEMYFDAFVRKMNRSAAFVKNDPRAQGSRKALVQISLNSDGSLKSYRVLRAADQQAEIAYIKSVIDRASPFSVFPPDILKGTDSLSILMCIYPPHAGGGGGFSRSFGGQDCRD